MLETLWSKQRIFEVYLNVIEWGNGVFGAEAAARHYFGIGAAQLGAGTGRATGRHGAEPALLRPQSQRAGPREARPAIIFGRMPSARNSLIRPWRRRCRC